MKDDIIVEIDHSGFFQSPNIKWAKPRKRDPMDTVGPVLYGRSTKWSDKVRDLSAWSRAQRRRNWKIILKRDVLQLWHDFCAILGF